VARPAPRWFHRRPLEAVDTVVNYLLRECCSRCRFQHASSSASWSRCSPPSSSVNGHMSTMWFMACRWPQLQEGDWVKQRCNNATALAGSAPMIMTMMNWWWYYVHVLLLGLHTKSVPGLSSLSMRFTIRYDTRCYFNARKPTWVSLIYRTELTTKKCKNIKTKN